MPTTTVSSDPVASALRPLHFWPDLAVGLLCLAVVSAMGMSALTGAFVAACGAVWVLLHRRRVHLQEIAALRAQAQSTQVYQSQSLTALEREIRSSLNGITGYAEYIAHHAVDPMIQFTGTIIHENSLRLLRTTDVMLDLIHSHDGEASSASGSFSLAPFFQALRLEYESALQQKSLLLECQIDEAIPDPLHGKGHLIRKVIGNLTENAIRFCEPRGRIRIHAEMAQDLHHVHVRVEDDGPLVADTNLSALLEHDDAPLLASVEHPLGDAGVSLAVAHRLALSIGGRVHHTPTLDKGNMFHFFFPLSSAE